MKEKRIPKLMDELAKKCQKLPEPIHVIAVCSGGRTVGLHISKYLKKKSLRVDYFEAWTNIVNNKAKISITNFTKKDYVGTVLIAEDVVWKGTSVKAVRAMLNKMKKKKTYLAVLLDMNKKADFSIFN
jgi:hypoxanthine phosphoribosyltransferase